MTNRSKTSATACTPGSPRWSAPLLIAMLLWGGAESASAQNPAGFTDVVEQVAAVVGDSVILMTEIDSQLLRMEAQGWTRPESISELMRFKADVLNQLINQQLVIQDAGKDSTLVIGEQELEERLEQEIDGQIRQFGTLSRLQDALAAQSMTMSVFRDQRRSAIRRELLQQRYMAKKGRTATDIFLNEEELHAFFDENQEEMPQLPPTVSFMNLQLAPKPTEEAKATALAKADSVLEIMRAGDQDDFGDLAKKYSDGPSAAAEGELGWVRRDGTFVEEFEEVAFRLSPGMVSLPTETDFGYHLIMVDRVRGGERRLRHILFQPEVTQADIDRNQKLATDFRDRLRAGEDIADLAELAEEPVDTLDLTIAEVNQISPAFASALQSAQAGDVVGPLSFSSQSANTLGLARVVEIKGGGVLKFEDVRDQIEARLKSDRLTESVVKDLRDRVFVEVRLAGAP
jgi:peptidyl-prolyl cis-trans isomerase SurA